MQQQGREIKMSKKITIIGAGSVGAAIGYTIAIKGLAPEVVFIDVAEEKAKGEAMDIYQGTSFCTPIELKAGGYADAEGSDVVVITSGLPRKSGQDRLELAQTNVNIIKQIAPQIVKYAPDAMYIIVSNPVDITTYAFTKISGIPENHIVGSGTLLDTARLQTALAERLVINPKNVHAYVMGEHGGSSFIPWSIANVAGVNVSELGQADAYSGKNIELDLDEIEKFVRSSGSTIIARKGYTNYAIAICVCHLIECLSNYDNAVCAVSTLMHGEYGIDDVCLSVPCVLGPGGVKGKILAHMKDSEMAKLRSSARTLRGVLENIEI